MDLRKKNIHMDYEKKRTMVQTTIEDDVNISDSKPDVASIVFKKGELFIDETKVTQDHLVIKGKMQFSVLYASNEGERCLYCMNGSIPVEEHVNMDGIDTNDMVEVSSMIEDISVTMINSRKISVRCLVAFCISADTMQSIAVPVALESMEPMEYCQEERRLFEAVVMNKDVYRIREEIDIPKSDPNIGEIIWSEVKIAGLDFRVQNEKIMLQGEMNVFFLYVSEDDNQTLRYYENIHPFSGFVNCTEAREGMIPVISSRVSAYELNAKPDYDGELRAVLVDVTLEMDVRVYEEGNYPFISDVYGVTKEVTTVRTKALFNELIAQNTLKQRLVERIRIAEDEGKILQLMHSKPEVMLDETDLTDDGLEVSGNVHVDILYISNDDKQPYNSIKGDIPFSYTIDIPGITAECLYDVKPDVEQIAVVMVDSNEVDVKIVLNFKTIAFCMHEEEIIDAIDVKEPDADKMNALPGMAVYVVGNNDTLWHIGKKYYVPVCRIKEMNNLTGDTVKKGDKLLIVR